MGFRDWGVSFLVHGLGAQWERVWDLGLHRVSGFGFRLSGFRIRNWGLGIKVKGSAFRV